MSSKITGNTITLTRGDTLRVLVTLTYDGEEYIPQEGDALQFALKRRLYNAKKTEFLDEEPLILKDIPIDTQTLVLEPEDTKSLGFGQYAYDIQITFADGTVDTFIPNATFYIREEVG